MRQLASFLALGVLGVAIAGCETVVGDADTTSGSAGTMSSSTGSGDGVALSVVSYDRLSTIAQVPAGAGKTFLSVQVSLTNGTSAAISLILAAVAVESDAGVRYGAAVEGQTLTGACEANSSLVPGGTVKCTYAFRVPTDIVTTKLVYTDAPTSTEYSTDFVIEPCSLCNGDCVDLQTDIDNCGSCNHPCTGADPSCANAQCQSCEVSGSVDTCQHACETLYDCGLAVCGGAQNCPNFSLSEKSAFVGNASSGCVASCNGNPAIKSVVDPMDCKMTVESFKQIQASFPAACGP